jgi:hypothetical protein
VIPLGCLVTILATACGVSSTSTTTLTAQSIPTVTATTTATVAARAESKPKQGRQAAKTGTITISGAAIPRTFGPFDFKPGGYRFSFVQLGDNDGHPWNQSTGFLVYVAGKLSPLAGPFQRLVNRSAKSGSTLMTKSGKLYVEVASGGPPYKITFAPLS